MANQLTQEDFDKYDAPNITKLLGEDDALVEIDAAKPITISSKTVDAKAEEMDQAVRTTHARRTLATREAFDKVVEKWGDPLDELASIGFNRGLEPAVRVNALKELASYGHSKLKTIEHTGANGEPLEFKMSVVNNILQMLQPESINVIDSPK